MSRETASTSFVTPVDSNGNPVAPSGGDAAFGVGNNRGVFTLAAGTFFFSLGGADAWLVHAMIQGDAAIAITSATIEETDLAESEAPLHSDIVGQWLATDIARITSTVEGTGWTNTNDVIANGAGNQGGAALNIADNGARRMRIKMVVGTEGQARVCTWGKG